MEQETASAGSRQRKQKLLSRARLSLRSYRGSQQTQNPKQEIKYIRGELIGKGSYGRVYLGLNARTGEIMAVKQVELMSFAIDRSAFRKQRDIVDAFKLEIDMLKDLDHAHIVKYLGYEENDEHLSIFLEYVPGGTIKSCLNKYGRFRDDVTKSFTFQILFGLKYLHSKGIIHRDLKADNILLDPVGVCKISDFGISKKVDDLQNIRAFTNMRGTVQWMAPEILDSKKAGYDAKVDIWSVGCVVLEMWSGEKPWNDENLVSVMYKVSQYKQPPPIPPGLKLSDLANDFRLQCFKANPQDRPTAAELQAHPFLRLPPDWTFPYAMHEDSTNQKSKSFSILDHRAPYAPTLRPVIKTSIVDIRTAQTLVSQNGRDDRTILVTKTTQPSVQDNGPPIVVITPPGSPRDRSYTYDEFELSTKLSDTSEGTRSSRHRRRKALVVANPDSDSDSDGPSNHASQRNQYVYAPPPLPETSFRQSNQLAPSRPSFPMHRRCHTEGGPIDVRRWDGGGTINSSPSPSSSVSPPASGHSSSTANSGLSLFGRPSRPRIDTSLDIAASDYAGDSDTDTDDDLHLWNKPPADLHETSSRRKLTCVSSPTLGRIGEEAVSPKSSRAAGTSMKTPRSASRKSWLTRPGLDDVYDHLQQFFPHHDVGQTFTQPRTSVLAPASGVENKVLISSDDQTSVQRSKRRQAEKPQSHLGQFYRMTKFWAEER